MPIDGLSALYWPLTRLQPIERPLAQLGKRMNLRFWMIGLVCAWGLVACGGRAAEPTAVPTAVSERCGDKSQLASELRFFNWGSYMDPDILAQFEAECGVKVYEDIFSGNEEMIAKIQAGNSGYDLVVPSDHAVQSMTERGLLRELDKGNIPNFGNLKASQIGLYYDPQNLYSVPYQWGVTGIAYNTAVFETPPSSWSVLFDPTELCQYSGFASLLDDERETLGAALVYLGYDYNDTTAEHHQEALALLTAVKPCLAGYDSDVFNLTLVSEEVVLAHAWSGAVAQARSENDKVAFFVPQEGGTIWQDNLAIPVDAPHPYTAEVFINYLLFPEIGAQLSNYTYFFTPNEAAEPLLATDYFAILQSGGMVVTPEMYERLEWIKRSDETTIFSDTWTALKAR